ncbi:MAG: hypothetical protein ABII95_03190 [Patescibacteria group bacterium]|nr:hypothetical protein [Patescibacteria group bacterium]MBU2068567.1 hypothetical protein [Patescibacteria group bacterium]
MSKITSIIISLVFLYSVTIIVPVVCDNSDLSKWSPCYWFYNQPIMFYVGLIIVLIVLNKLVKLIKRKEKNDK